MEQSGSWRSDPSAHPAIAQPGDSATHLPVSAPPDDRTLLSSSDEAAETRLEPTMAALATHFVLLRAPLTLDLASWRGPLGLWFVGLIALAGFGAVYIARHGGEPGRSPIYPT